MQNKVIEIELKDIDIRANQVRSCPAVAVPIEDDSIGGFMNNRSGEGIELGPPILNLPRISNDNAVIESRIPSNQAKAKRKLRKVKSAHPDINNFSGRQVDNKTDGSSDEDRQTPRRMPDHDEDKEEAFAAYSDFKGPPLPRRVWSWLFCLTLALYYTAVLAIMLKLLVFQFQENPFPLDSTSGAILSIAENYRYDPIINVQLTTEQCPTGFVEAKLTTWPGTRDGCFSLDDGSLQPELCNDIDLLKKESVYSITEQDLYNWKGYTWCIRRASREIDYVFTENCPDGFRNCGNGYCFNESISCPITELTFTDPQTNSNATDGSGLLTIRREEGQLPLVSINVSINGLPCFSLNEDPLTESPYALLKTRKNGCLSFGVDQSSFEIDRDIQENFLEDNNPISTILNLPGYQSILESTTAILVGRRKLNVTVNSFCTNLNIGVLEKAGDGIQALNSAYTKIVTSAVILHLIIGLVLLSFFSGRIWPRRSLGQILWRGGLCYRVFFLFFFVLEIAALITLTIYVIIYKAKINNADLYFNQVISSDCFGQTQAADVITNFSKFESETVNIIFVYSIVASGIALIFLVILARAVCYARKPSPSI